MAKSATTIAAGTVIRGRIHGEESIELLGRVEGHVEISGSLTVDAKARADAEIQAASVFIDGIVVGNVTAEDTIHVTGKAIAAGDLTAAKIIVDDGARIRGFVKMTGAPKTRQKPSTTRATAPAATVPPAAPDQDEDEPELPSSASKRRVSVKKR
ncbi:MAG: polymer-forming cytoskeletal protein [Myxococcota bacterium]|nr:polymer-forming cytoskeletal protein [Myxococcota bacterium]